MRERHLFLRPTATNLAVTRPWIELELVDSDGHPLAGERYRVEFPDESVVEGKLDADGKVFLETTQPGACFVQFPGLDRQKHDEPALPPDSAPA